MAETLLKYYKYVYEERGLLGKMELAQQTKIPSTLAATAPDNSENIELFREVVQKITGKDAPEL